MSAEFISQRCYPRSFGMAIGLDRILKELGEVPVITQPEMSFLILQKAMKS